MNEVNTPQSRLRAGVARGDITPPVGIYHRMWGAAFHDRATGVHRPLLATLLWLAPLEGNANDAQLIVAIDHCIFDRSEMENLRKSAASQSGISPENVRIALSHTHGAGYMSRSRADLPGGELIGPYLDRVAAQLADLAVEAKQSVTPATIVYGQGKCSLAAQRDFFDEARGHFVCGFNPGGPADDALLVARIVDAAGKTRGTIVNYACHPTTLAWDNTAISPDWIGAMRETVESATRAPCVFLQGASGDLGPREGYVGDHAAADKNGRQVGYAALAALESLPAAGMKFQYASAVLSGCWIGTWKHAPLDAVAIKASEGWQWRRFVVDLPYRGDLPTREQTRCDLARYSSELEKATAARDEAKIRDSRASAEQMRRQLGRLEALPEGKTYPLAVAVGRVGDALFVLAPGELYQVFQTALRERFSPRPVIVSTVTDDWQPGYLPARDSYGQGIYQEIISAVAPGSLELLMDAVAHELTKLS